MQPILKPIVHILATANQEVLDDICNTCRKTREKAIAILTKSLDEKSERDNTIFQSIPLELLNRGDHLGAIWYIETIGKVGNPISLEVIEKVMEGALRERRECTFDGDSEFLHALDVGLISLSRMAKNNTSLKDSSSLYLLIGRFEQMRGRPQKAIAHYNEAIGKKDTEGYLSLAKLYEELGEYDTGIKLLEDGYNLHSDIRLLGELIRILCRANKVADARMKYEILKSMNGSVPPFIVYKGSIENDAELGVVESMIASYITENLFDPSETLAELSRCSSDYVNQSIQLINDSVGELNKKNTSDWIDEEHTKYRQLMTRRLWLMQVDILSIGNDRYISFYLRDLIKLGLEESPERLEILRSHFIESSSEEVIHHKKKRGELEDPESEQFRKMLKQSVFDDIFEHVSRVGDFFCQPCYYDIFNNQIVPLLKKLNKLEGEDDEEGELDTSLQELKVNTNFFHSLRPSVRKNYEFFLRSIESKYGVFYRRHIQSLANNIDFVTDQIPGAIKDHSDIALLFWIDVIIAHKFPTDDPNEIDKIVAKYSIDNENTANTLLFGLIIYEVSIEYAVSFLCEYPNMLNIPEALYLVTEGLRSIEREYMKQEIHNINKLVKHNYDAISLFDHINQASIQILEKSDSDEDREYMLLTNGNTVILSDGDRNQAIKYFETAGTEYESAEGLAQTGDSYQDAGEYNRALEFYIRALNKEDTERNLTKILNCTISSAQFKIAEQYIQYGLNRGFNIETYIFAFHLWQGNTNPAFLQMIKMINSEKVIDNRPEGVMTLLVDTLRDIIDTPESMNYENNKLKIYASFIQYIMENGNFIEPEIFIVHWQYIDSIFSSYDGEQLHSFIEDTLSPLTGALDTDIKEILSSSDQSLEYLDTHASRMYITLKRLLSKTQEIKLQGEILDCLNNLAYFVIQTFRRFPDSKKYITKWQSRIRFRDSIDTKRIAHHTSYTMTYH